jgi:hypothetical protein
MTLFQRGASPVVPASVNSFVCKGQFLLLSASWWNSVGLSQLVPILLSDSFYYAGLVMTPTVVFYYCRNAFLTDKTTRLICTFSDAKYMLLQSAIEILSSSSPSLSSDVLQFLCRCSNLTLCMHLHTTPLYECLYRIFSSLNILDFYFLNLTFSEW